MAKCPSCGLAVSSESVFCSKCGAAIHACDRAETVAIATPPPSPKSAEYRTPSHADSWHRLDEGRFIPGVLLAGRYRIVALLGKGGMGEVYRAEDLTLGQQVALKFLPEALSTYPEAVARFHNEVRTARQVSHPNVCRVYDVGEIEGQLFLSMEYVDGEDLGALLRRIGRLPGDKALEIARRLCAGLAAAHEKGVLHRDLKPGNVMLDGRGQVVLTDFGLAGLADQIQGLEVRNGTPAYMAPEQLTGKEVTVRSDIYSLGLVLYEIVTGRRPFEASTLEELIHVRTKTVPTNPSTLVRDLDPMVERVILRCLDPDPARRPPSPLAVSAALPGGDPLAAALAAGETPSPEMVAAAGEGTALAPRIALPLFIAVLLGMTAHFVLEARSGALGQIRPEYSPEVLTQKARDLLQRLGYSGPRTDDAHGFFWEGGLIDYVRDNDKPSPNWKELLSQGPPVLRFWYRESPYPLIGTEFHDDLLTPGIVTREEPSSILSGMIDMDLDSQGRLLRFETMPPQLENAKPKQPEKPAAAPDWNVLFTAAGLDITNLKPAQPLWTTLASSDTRMAWTGTWPGTARPLRVEAAAWQGRPVAFSLIGPWTKPERMPPRESSTHEQARLLFYACLAVVMIFGGALLARHNVLKGSGHHTGALRLGAAVFCIHFALWVCRAHFVWSIGTFAMFLLAVCTSLAWAAVLWTIYVAIEPFVRRHWPQTIISWTSVLTGRVRDPIVGRDVLIGAAAAVSFVMIDHFFSLPIWGSVPTPELGDTAFLLGARSTVGAWLMRVPYGVRGALVFFFVIFLLRVLLRNQWLAAGAFVLLFTGLQVLGSNHPLASGLANLTIYILITFVVLRYGLVSLAVAIFVEDLLGIVPRAWDPSAWYFGSTIFILASAVALTAWAFYTSIAGRPLWKQSIIDL